MTISNVLKRVDVSRARAALTTPAAAFPKLHGPRSAVPTRCIHFVLLALALLFAAQLAVPAPAGAQQPQEALTNFNLDSANDLPAGIWGNGTTLDGAGIDELRSIYAISPIFTAVEGN